MKARAGVRLSVLVGLICVFAAGRADAQTTCMTDKDCPGTTCGSQVCLHNSGQSLCVDANTAGLSGLSDGWCADTNGAAVDSNCKCASQGATCRYMYCTFTVPPDGGAGGSTGHAGTSGSTGGDSGCSVAGAPSLAWAGVGMLVAAVLMRRRRRA
jgi:MYXO-CTERM domain-containing protein